MSIDDDIERANPIISFLAGVGVSAFEKVCIYGFDLPLPIFNIFILGLGLTPLSLFRKGEEIIHHGTGEWGSNEKSWDDRGADFRGLGIYLLGAGLVYGPEIYKIGKLVIDYFR